MTAPVARTPMVSSSAARSRIRFVVDTNTTDAPSWPNRFAVAKPIPLALPAPVTKATWPVSRSSSDIQ